METQTEGYFDSPKFLKQVSKAIDILNVNTHRHKEFSFLIMLHATRNVVKIR